MREELAIRGGEATVGGGRSRIRDGVEKTRAIGETRTYKTGWKDVLEIG